MGLCDGYAKTDKASMGWQFSAYNIFFLPNIEAHGWCIFLATRKPATIMNGGFNSEIIVNDRLYKSQYKLFFYLLINNEVKQV